MTMLTRATQALHDSLKSAWWRVRRIDPLYWLRSRFIPSRRYHVINTGLAPGWHDADELILHGCMVLLCRYVEDECGGAAELQEWTDDLRSEPGAMHAEEREGQAAAQDEHLAIHRWWTVQRPADHARLDAWCDKLFMDKDESMGAYEQYCAFEDELDARDQEMLHRLIDIRRGLWA